MAAGGMRAGEGAGQVADGQVVGGDRRSGGGGIGDVAGMGSVLPR